MRGSRVIVELTDECDAEVSRLWMRTPSIILFPLALVPSAMYMIERNAVVTDVLGVSFAANAIGLLRLDSFKTGVTLLGGLFVYDVWWVFGTEVVSVAHRSEMGTDVQTYRW